MKWLSGLDKKLTSLFTDKIVWILISILTIWGFVLRVYQLGYLSVWLDEAISVYAAKMVALKGIPLLESGWLYTAGLPQSYFLAIWGYVFGWSEFWVRFPSVVIGTALIPLSYYVVQYIWNKRVGLAVAFFITFSYWQIAWSRQARMYVWLELFFYLSLYFGYRFVNEKKGLYGVFAGVFAVLSAATHGFGILVFPLLAIMWFFTHKTFRLPGGVWMQILYSVIGVLGAWYVVKGVFALEFAYPYFFQYLSWLMKEYYSILFLFILAVFIGWKERFLVGFLITYSLLLGYVVFLFHFRYFVWVAPIAALLCFLVLDWKVKWNVVFGVCVVLVLFGIHTLIIPQTEIYLEEGTPQPPWREVYMALPDNVTFSDANPVIADYYGRRPDGWVRNSLTGINPPEVDPYTALVPARTCYYVYSARVADIPEEETIYYNLSSRGGATIVEECQ